LTGEGRVGMKNTFTLPSVPSRQGRGRLYAHAAVKVIVHISEIRGAVLCIR